MHFFAAKLLSIAVMTYVYVYHLLNLRPMIRLICYAHSEWTSARNRSMTRDPTVVWYVSFENLHTPRMVDTIENTGEYRISFILPEIRVPEPRAADRVWVYLYLILHNCFRKPRKDVQDHLLSLNVFFLENSSEYPHKPYTDIN